MKEKCVVDSSVIVKIILFKDEKLFKAINSSFIVFIPLNALEEACFIILRETVKEKFREERYFEMKRIFEKENLPEFTERIILLNFLGNLWNILDINFEIFEIAKSIMKKYKLLPNDALIAATCKYYGIRKIATFDEDFEKIDFVEVVKV